MQIIIRPSDIMILYRLGKSAASKLLQGVKDSLGKNRKQDVSIREFCEYRGLNYDEVLTALNIKKK